MEGKGWRYNGRYLDVFGTVPVSHRSKYPAGTSETLYMLDKATATAHFFLNKKGIEMWRVEYESPNMSAYDVLGRIRLIRSAINASWQR